MRIGIDVGGTKIEGILMDAGGNEALRRRIPTPAGDYEAIIAAITDWSMTSSGWPETRYP